MFSKIPIYRTKKVARINVDAVKYFYIELNCQTSKVIKKLELSLSTASTPNPQIPEKSIHPEYSSVRTRERCKLHVIHPLSTLRRLQSHIHTHIAATIFFSLIYAHTRVCAPTWAIIAGELGGEGEKTCRKGRSSRRVYMCMRASAPLQAVVVGSRPRRSLSLSLSLSLSPRV